MMHIFSCALHKRAQLAEDTLVNSYSCEIFSIGHVQQRPNNTRAHMGTHTHTLGLPVWAHVDAGTHTL